MKIGDDQRIRGIVGDYHSLFGNHWRQQLPDLLGVCIVQRHDLGDYPIVGARHKAWRFAEFHTLLSGLYRGHYLDHLASRHGSKAVYLQYRLKHHVCLVHGDFARRENRHFTSDLIVHYKILAGQLTDKLNEHLDIDLVKIHTDGLFCLSLGASPTLGLSMPHGREAEKHHKS